MGGGASLPCPKCGTAVSGRMCPVHMIYYRGGGGGGGLGGGGGGRSSIWRGGGLFGGGPWACVQAALP